MKGYCLVTGASSGIGRAIAVHMSRQGFGVLAVARREEKLAETRSLGVSDNITTVAADVSTLEGRAAIAAKVREVCPRKLNYVVQNAGVIGKIQKAMDVDYESWKAAFAVNVDAPLFLTQQLLPEMASGGRILHVGSGAAHGPMDGWITYNTTKAAFYMMYKCLNKELASQGVHVGSLKPGVIESPMQETIRAASKEAMELVDNFRKMKENEYCGSDLDRPHKPPTNGLDTAANAAHFIGFLLTETDADEFGAKEWDIRDEEHHSRWIK